VDLGAAVGQRWLFGKIAALSGNPVLALESRLALASPALAGSSDLLLGTRTAALEVEDSQSWLWRSKAQGKGGRKRGQKRF
jgi:hypothetical protein